MGGTYDIGANLTGVKLWIGDYNNDGTNVYPIYCEDENNKVDFWIKSRTNQTTGLPTMFFDGRFGIGTTSPSNSRLQLEGANSYDATIRLNNTGTNGADFFMGSTSDTWEIGGGKFVMGHGLAQSPNVDFALNSQGYIGIGTTTPEGMIHLKSKGDVLLIVDADSTNMSGEENYNPRIELRQDKKQVIGAIGYVGSSGEIYPGSIANSLYLMNEFESPMHFGTDSLIRMTLTETGLLGINTDTPIARLSVEAKSGLIGYYNSAEKGLVVRDGAYNTGNDFEVQNSAGAIKFVINDDGKVGIGTANPESPLEISGGGTSAGLRVRYSDTYPGVYGEFKHGQGAGLIINAEAGGAGWGDLSLQTNGTTRMFIENTGKIGIGTTTPSVALDVIGHIKTQVLEITGGSDLAEPFEISGSESLEPGSVVIIDDFHQGQLKLSEKAYDKKVAGVVSGAGGVNPGITLNQDNLSQNGQNIALAGRVYVKTTTSNGAIEPGDMLTTSQISGYAMKVTDNNRAYGAVIGKAMSSLKQGEGLVLVLVNLQ